ncbi:hypothetical protein N1F78_05985 [Seonamhaeicola sp. MEBiC1930]|uniref:hypothetical protein n=1 Tax=Seonamhaeicola sp. MEBiC01930 TaxID=2976768 RepID=UPI003246F805
MKTKLFSYVCSILLLLVFSGNIYSQNFSENLFESQKDLTSFVDTFELDTSVSYDYDESTTEFEFNTESPLNAEITLEPQSAEELIVFASTMIALGAGIGFGEDQTLWCLHAAYYMRLAMYTKSALFGSFGVVLDGFSGNSFTRNLMDFQFKLLMFHAITKYYQVHFIYGAMLAYAIGSEKFDAGSKYDLTRLTAALVLGFNIILTSQLAIMLQTNILAHQNWTQKLDDMESKSNSTLGFINKQNLFVLSLVWTIANSRR